MASAGAAWRVAAFRPGSDPIARLARALAQPGVLFDEPLTGPLPAEEPVTWVNRADLPSGTQVLVIVAPFEELFRFRALARTAATDTGSRAEDAISFVRLLFEASGPRSRFTFS